jgi:tRNA pseudouridine38-40 synthase
MNSKRFLIRLQFLGFRYHGVQKQLGYQTIQGRIEAVISAFFKDNSFGTRFSSRTDAFVSAEECYCLLMFQKAATLESVQESLSVLPPDIQILEIKTVSENFTMLKVSGKKEYHYYFSYGIKIPHVFATPLMTILREELDIEIMKEGAKIFRGHHNFKNYCYKPRANVSYEREILSSEIVDNTILTASFFPERSYIFKISAQGFMRGQVRLMMGALFRLGKREMTLDELKHSLVEETPSFVKWMVPGSGLVLHKTSLRPLD